MSHNCSYPPRQGSGRAGKRWYYHFPGEVYAYGPTTYRYATEREARKAIRRAWNLKKLPRGTELWEASDVILP